MNYLLHHKIKWLLMVLLSVSLQQPVYSQKVFTKSVDTIHQYFREIELASKLNFSIWKKDLYGPILLVNPISRETYANFPDTGRILKQSGPLFTGKLPFNILIGNISLNWGGLKWAMILTPFVSEKAEERIDLFSHELFHRVQPDLGFSNFNELSNDHLDTKNGRILIRLELEALKKAFQTVNSKERISHVRNAFGFRWYRYRLFPEAYLAEASVEINEGVASYTGKLSRRLTKEAVAILMHQKIDSFFRQKSYVKMFAYETIPAYGFLLKQTEPEWHMHIKMETNLTDFFMQAFKISGDIKQLSESTVMNIGKKYGSEKIISFETEREDVIQKTIAVYKKRFLEDPHFILPFSGKKSISSDSRQMVSIDQIGRVNPSMKIVADWGILDINGPGGFLPTSLDKVIITVPLNTEGQTIKGEGWVLQLNEGYEIVKEASTGNYILKRKK